MRLLARAYVRARALDCAWECRLCGKRAYAGVYLHMRMCSCVCMCPYLAMTNGGWHLCKAQYICNPLQTCPFAPVTLYHTSHAHPSASVRLHPCFHGFRATAWLMELPYAGDWPRMCSHMDISQTPLRHTVEFGRWRCSSRSSGIPLLAQCSQVRLCSKHATKSSTALWLGLVNIHSIST